MKAQKKIQATRHVEIDKDEGNPSCSNNEHSNEKSHFTSMKVNTDDSEIRETSNEGILADINSGSIVDEKRAIASRGFGFRNASKHRENRASNVEILNEKRAIAGRSHGVRNAAKRSENSASHAADFASLIGNVMDETQVIASRSLGVRNASKQKENNDSRGVVDWRASRVDDKRAIATRSIGR